MSIDNRLRRLREVLCSTALAVAPLTSIIVGIPLIGHSLAYALCPSTDRNHDSSLRRKKGSSKSERNRADEALPVAWRNFFFTLRSDAHDSRE
jgi:hypothetical protein